MRNSLVCISAAAFLFAQPAARAAVLEYGDADVLGTGSYAVDPRSGASLQGLAPGTVTFGAPAIGHGFPFTPAAGDFPGTDQIFAGSAQTGFHDGYSSSPRSAGPQVLVLDYSSLVPSGMTVGTFTLGLAADDFQFPTFGQPFSASVNGVPNSALTAVLNGIDQGGPQVQFFTIGIAPSSLLSSHVLTLAIDQAGDGGDGWAVDFLTAGVTLGPTQVPAPASSALAALGLLCLGVARSRRARPAAT